MMERKYRENPVNWLFLPRYSALLIIVAALCFGIIYGSKYYSYQKHIAKITQSPLSKISVGQMATVPYRDKDIYKKAYTFYKEDWFLSNIPIWEKILAPYKNKPTIYLEIGVFQGRSLFWMLENILIDSNSKATIIDPFFKDYECDFLTNLKLSGLDYKVKTIKGYSQIELRNLPFDYYDIIYIDGSHVKSDVLEDAVLSWRLVKPGGLIIFDDYGYGTDITHKKPFYLKDAVDYFAMSFDNQFEVVHNGFQIILRRK